MARFGRGKADCIPPKFVHEGVVPNLPNEVKSVVDGAQHASK